MELGFKADKFQYGIGRDAFDTLDDADLDGRELNLASSGWTYKNTFVLYDRETIS